MNQQPVTWLAVARAQSQRLADARAAQLPPFRVPTRAPHHPLRWALAGALALLLVASGSWAVVTHTRRPLPPPPPQEVAPPPPPPARAVTPSAPTLVAKNPRRKVKKPRPQHFEEGDGELILVAPHPPQPPLFSPQEFKERR